MTFKPMKAVLTDERFSDPGRIYERKLDGIRCLAFKGDRRVSAREGRAGVGAQALTRARPV